ncbi:MAG: hypothetical protein JRJ12_17270 [Deltaproteobacteria bacterium]|nr:hypothetical protein [Deltaproteobacteria bacterium]
MVEKLASYRRCVECIRSNWPAFREKRRERMVQQERHGVAAERVTENILEDLFTIVLDWSISDINHQIGHADLLLTRLGIKYLIMEAKRPGALAWNRRSVEAALEQARRYADEQKVRCIGVSDGLMFYAADIEHGGLQDRVFVALDSSEPQEALWWVSVHGIYRPRKDRQDAALRLLPEAAQEQRAAPESLGEVLLHPKYKIPARCFGYVGDASDPRTWKLPYRIVDGAIDLKRLPKAIQAILSNYRGTKVSGIPEQDIPDVLVRLAHAAASLGKMPHQSGKPAAIYQQLADVLDQLGRLQEIM